MVDAADFSLKSFPNSQEKENEKWIENWDSSEAKNLQKSRKMPENLNDDTSVPTSSATKNSAIVKDRHTCSLLQAVHCNY